MIQFDVQLQIEISSHWNSQKNRDTIREVHDDVSLRFCKTDKILRKIKVTRTCFFLSSVGWVGLFSKWSVTFSSHIHKLKIPVKLSCEQSWSSLWVNMNRSVMFGFLENFPILGLYLTLKIVLTPCNRPDICMLLFTTKSPDIMNQHSFHASKYFVSRGEEALYIEFTSDFTQKLRLSSITQHFSLSLLPFREYNQGMHAVYNKGNHVV